MIEAMAEKRPLDILETAFVSTPSPKRSRKQYSVDFKRSCLKEAKEYGNIFVSRKYNLDESMVRRWTRESTKLDSAVLELKKPKALKLGSGRKPFDEDIDEETFVYIVSLRAQNLRVTRTKIQYFAKDLAGKKYPGNTFAASNGWLDGFMKRNGLSLRQKTHQSQRLTSEILPKVLEFLMVSIVSPQK